ncbi:Nucleoside diphosphate kinase 2, chloroplastic [Turnera subulata]|uniref:Nucleoside diphosphate kinase n=1 Tax=Turnera subulata TaxID=218843 RepID=A0A9Q0JEE7_9ROSI|nr:Nucleoside diphosphate kinase 2, chloroplastic [Turnera subulata]
METVGVLGGAKPCLTSSSVVLRSSTQRSGSSYSTLSYAPCKKQHLNLRTTHISAFHSHPHVAKPRNSTKPRTFLPRVVASLEQVEETYIMVKPDGVQRGLVGEIISRFEKKGFKLTGLKLFQCPKELAEEHYKDLNAKPFFPKLIDYITSGPVVCMAWEGDGVVASARKLIGSTNPLQAEPGTIRGDLAVQTGRNVVHGSDSPENGKREIGLWFKDGELCQWTPAQASWLRE